MHALESASPPDTDSLINARTFGAHGGHGTQRVCQVSRGKSREDARAKLHTGEESWQKTSTMFVTYYRRAVVMVRSAIRACQGEKPREQARDGKQSKPEHGSQRDDWLCDSFQTQTLAGGLGRRPQSRGGYDRSHGQPRPGTVTRASRLQTFARGAIRLYASRGSALTSLTALD